MRSSLHSTWSGSRLPRPSQGEPSTRNVCSESWSFLKVLSKVRGDLRDASWNHHTNKKNFEIKKTPGDLHFSCHNILLFFYSIFIRLKFACEDECNY